MANASHVLAQEPEKTTIKMPKNGKDRHRNGKRITEKEPEPRVAGEDELIGSRVSTKEQRPP
jgi:hypothetical protein